MNVAATVAAKMLKARGGKAEAKAQSKAMSKSKRIRFSKKGRKS